MSHTKDALIDHMNTPTHTTTPWAYVFRPDGGFIRPEHPALPICRMLDYDVQTDKNIIKSNGHFICRAVNSHYELVAALEMFFDPKHNFPVKWMAPTSKDQKSWNEFYELASQSLAKATQGQP